MLPWWNWRSSRSGWRGRAVQDHLAGYTDGMTHKVGTKGQVVIPKAIRDQTGIEPGDEVAFEADGAEVTVRRADDPERRAREIRALRGAWGDTAGGGTADLEAERRGERELEERKAQRWGVGRP